MMLVTRKYRFSASHRLHAPELGEAENRQLYGKCNNPFGHGHNYEVAVTVRGPVEARSGRVVDLDRLDGLVRRNKTGVRCFRPMVLTWKEWPSPRPAATHLKCLPMKSNKANVKVMTPKADASIAPLIKQVLERLGEDTARDGLARTPERVERALQFLTSGYTMDVNKVVNGALFEVKYDEMVIMKDIEFFSMCEHHMLPFFGKVHVAYIPRDRVIGLSKLPRLVDVFARRLQIQERMTQQIAQTIQELIDPVGVGVICEARHFCMMMRGVEKQHSGAVTSTMLGAFRNQKETRDEFLALVK